VVATTNAKLKSVAGLRMFNQAPAWHSPAEALRT